MFGGVLKPTLNEQEARHCQHGGYFPSFANYRLLKSTSMSTQRIQPRSGAAPVISRFWDCQKKSFRLWRVLKRRDFHDRSKGSEGWSKEDFLGYVCGRNAIRTKSKTTQGRAGTRFIVPIRVAFRYANRVGTLN